MESKDLCKEKHDFNQNLIEPSHSFQQLCNMINQLEKNSDIEVAECNRIDTCIKFDADLELASRKCPIKVSDRNRIYKNLLREKEIVKSDLS